MNWEIIITSLITATPPTIMALLAWRESKKIHTSVNSRMTELLSVTKSEAHSAGRDEMREENITNKK